MSRKHLDCAIHLAPTTQTVIILRNTAKCYQQATVVKPRKDGSYLAPQQNLKERVICLQRSCEWDRHKYSTALAAQKV